MRLAWLTDIHFDFLTPEMATRFCEEVAASGAEGVLVGGDTATAATFAAALRKLADVVHRPIWFVLGNHDFYGGGVSDVRQSAAGLSNGRPIVWLGGVDVVALTPNTGLVGHDGWGDARHGNHAGSRTVLSDFLLIADLVDADKAELGRRLNRLGDEAASHLRRVLPPALERFEHVVVLTHVPPFREAAWHQGRISDDDWLPYFSCKATGDVLMELVSGRPERRVTVLCGHTHSAGEYAPLPNLRVITGAARYRQPTIQQPLLDL